MNPIDGMLNYLSETVKTFSASGLTTLATVSVWRDWIDVGTDVMTFISVSALATLNVFILCNWIHRKFLKK